MYKQSGNPKRYSKVYGQLAVGFVVGGVLVLLVILIANQNRDQYQVPSAVKSQLSFPLLFLKKSTNEFKLDTSSIKYSTQSDGSKVFSFIIYDTNNRITFSEQAYPPVLIYDKFTGSLNPYSEVGTAYGAVTLGMPKDGGGHQVAGFKYQDGTLILAESQTNIKDSDWQRVINSLGVIQ